MSGVIKKLKNALTEQISNELMTKAINGEETAREEVRGLMKSIRENNKFSNKKKVVNDKPVEYWDAVIDRQFRGKKGEFPQRNEYNLLLFNVRAIAEDNYDFMVDPKDISKWKSGDWNQRLIRDKEGGSSSKPNEGEVSEEVKKAVKVQGEEEEVKKPVKVQEEIVRIDSKTQDQIDKEAAKELDLFLAQAEKEKKMKAESEPKPQSKAMEGVDVAAINKRMARSMEQEKADQLVRPKESDRSYGELREASDRPKRRGASGGAGAGSDEPKEPKRTSPGGVDEFPFDPPVAEAIPSQDEEPQMAQPVNPPRDPVIPPESVQSVGPSVYPDRPPVDMEVQKVSKVPMDLNPTTIDMIPDSRLASDNKSQGQLRSDIMYFFKNFPKPLINLRNAFRNIKKMNLEQLIRFHKRIVGILQPNRSGAGDGKRVGVVIDAEEYIRKIVGETMISKAIEGYAIPNLAPIGGEAQDARDPETKDIGSYEVKRGPDGGLNSQKEPIYRYIPTTQDEAVNESQYDYQTGPKRLNLPPTKMRNRVQTGKRQVRQNPFLEVKKGHRLNVLL